MSVGSLGGQTFLIDPESIAYHFDIKASSQDTVGGKVVQVFGTRVSDLIVTGSFGTGGWQYQQQWLTFLTQQAQAQVGVDTYQGYQAGTPIRFTYPPRGWDFPVFLIAYTQPDGPMSIELDNEIINPKWTLTLFIVNDNGQLTSETNAALISYISRLSTGIGWGVSRALTDSSGNTAMPTHPQQDVLGQ